MRPRRKLLLCSLALVAGAVLADRVIGPRLLAGGLYAGRPLPPFGRIAQPHLREWVDQELALASRGGRGGIFGTFHAEFGWTNWPGRSQGFTTGALGTRGPREYAKEKPAGTTRVLCYGDSYTYGSEVRDGEDWPALLEASAPNLEALNFGVAAYGTDQALLRFRAQGRELGGDALVIGVHLWTIGRNVNRYRQLFYPPAIDVRVKPRFVLEDGALRLVPQPFRSHDEVVAALQDDRLVALLEEHEYWSGDDPWLAGSVVARMLAGERAYARREPRRLWSDVEGEPFRVTLAILEAFHREALEAGVPRVVVLVTGFRDDLHHLRKHGKPYWQPLLDALAALDIDCIDAASAMAEEAAQRDLFLDTHLNAEGNVIVARMLHAWLFEEH